MTCKAIPAGFFPPIPSLPGGVGIPTFSPPTPALPNLCCNIPALPWGDFPLPLPPLPPGALTAVTNLISEIEGVVSSVFDAIAIPCPME